MDPTFLGEGVPSTEHLLRSRNIPWDIYKTARLISEQELHLLHQFDKKNPEIQARLLEENGPMYFAAFLSVLKNVTKDETVQYVLAMFDQILEIDPASKAPMLHAAVQVQDSSENTPSSDAIYLILLRLLNRNDWYTQEKAAHLLTAAIAYRPNPSAFSELSSISSTTPIPSNEEPVNLLDNDLSPSSPQSAAARKPVSGVEAALISFIGWLTGQLRRPRHEDQSILASIHSLSILLRERPTRALFIRSGGLRLLPPLVAMPLDGAQLNIQLLYEATLCTWQLSFERTAAEALAVPGLIGGLVDILRLAHKEKLVRVALLALKNLLTIPGKAVALEYAAVEKGLPKAIEVRSMQTWDDEDIPPLLEWMTDHLEHGILSMSSFERYKGELQSGRLTWGPTHDSDIFWSENAEKLIDKNCALLKLLLRLLDPTHNGGLDDEIGVGIHRSGSNAADSTTVAIACKDLANFVRHAPHGRGVAADLGAKEVAMRLMMHPDVQVQREAFMLVQAMLLSKDKLNYISAF
jgi:V-type H+-transporting ATPase subunit H